MGHLDRHATIAAPPATVYAYIAEVRNAPRYIAAIERITSGPAGAATVGQRYGALAHFLGQPEQLTLRVLDLQPAQRVTFALEGIQAATLTIHLRPHGPQATRVDVRLEAPGVPTIMLGLAMGPMLDQSLRQLAGAMHA